MDRGTRRILAAALAAAAAALVAVAVAAAIGRPALVTQPGAASLLLAGGLFVGLSALSAALIVARHHFDELERLHGELLATAAGAEPSPHGAEPLAGEIGRIARLAAEALKEREAETRQVETRLQAVVAAASEAIVVVTESGLVSLLNAAARHAPGLGHLEVGTSVYGAIDRDSFLAAAGAARATGRPAAVRLRAVDGAVLPARLAGLPDHAGTVLFLPAAAADAEPALHHDLTLHDRPPQAEPAPATPLESLPMLALDLETTGLDPASARIVAVGAVRMHGLRIYRHITLDRLVDPGVRVPRAATRVHGITSAMVAGAPCFADLWPEIAAMMQGVVLVGHHVGFDLAMLARETARIGVAWQAPPSLDTALLAAAVEPRATDFDLEEVARRFGVPVQGRHTALGDALLAAELCVRLIPRLRDRGVRTLDEAVRFAAAGRRRGGSRRAGEAR